MSDHTRPRLQLQSWRLSELALDPRRADRTSGIVFQRVGQVNDRASCVARDFPVLARATLIGGKESEIQAVELFTANALDKSDLVSHGFKLAESFVVIEQLDVNRREIAIVEHFRNFFSFQRAGAYDCNPVQIAAKSFGSRRSRWLELRTHEGWEASLYTGGAGGLGLRRIIHCKRHQTPEIM